MKRKVACSCIVVAAVLWGIIGIFYRQLSAAGFSSMQIVTIRVSVAAIAMWMYLYAADKNKLKIQWKDSLGFVGTGMCSLVFFNWCYFNAMEQTSLAVASVLLYTAPVFVLLMSVWLFGEVLTIKKICVLILVFGGCVLVSGGGWGSKSNLSVAGVLYGLGAGAGYALYSILGTYLLRKYRPETVCVYTFIFAAAGSVMLADFKTESLTFFISGQVLLAAAGIGILCSMLPFMLYTKGLTQIPASKASALATLEPAIATVIGVVCFHESMNAVKICGIFLILGGVLLLSSPSRQRTDG